MGTGKSYHYKHLPTQEELTKVFSLATTPEGQAQIIESEDSKRTVSLTPSKFRSESERLMKLQEFIEQRSGKDYPYYARYVTKYGLKHLNSQTHIMGYHYHTTLYDYDVKLEVAAIAGLIAFFGIRVVGKIFG